MAPILRVVNMRNEIVSQRSFPAPDRRHSIKITMTDLMFKRCDNAVLAFQEVRTCKIFAGNGMMRDERAVTGKILHKGFKLDKHLLLRKRCELSPLRFFQKRSTRKQRQTTRADYHRLALTEYFCGIDGMIVAMLSACHTIEKCHPVVDA